MNRRKKVHGIRIIVLLLVPVAIWSQAVTVDFSKEKQVIDGFGGSSAWCGAYNDALMDAIFKNGEDQLGFTILRSRIDPGKNWNDEISNIHKAKARGATTFATPWSPPPAMKTNGNVNNGGEIKSGEWGNYALYLKEFIDKAGEDLDIISLQNEPDYTTTYESCRWNGNQFRDFCKDHAATLDRPVMIGETVGFNWSITDPTLNDPDAEKNVAYVGGHHYGSQPKRYTKAIDLGKKVWMTEWNINLTDTDSDMKIAKQALDCMHSDYNAYVYWWMTWDGNGIISKQGIPNRNGYILSMFGRWVRPGYYRVEATYNPQSGLYVVAFKGKQNVLVVLNNSGSSKNQSFTYSNATVSSVKKYTTSRSKNAVSDGTIDVTNNSFSTSFDAKSLTTLVSEGSVAITPYTIDNRHDRMEPAMLTTGHSDATTTVMYLINGKRSRLHGCNDLSGNAKGIFIINGKRYTTITDNRVPAVSTDK